MGAGIAVAMLDAGMHGDDDRARRRRASARGRANVEKVYDSLVAKGRLSAEAKAAVMARFDGAIGYDALAEVDLVVEAVFEDMAVKKAVFAELDRVCKPGAVLATNTSYLDIDEIAASISRPQDVLGLHFFSPAHIMKLLEIVVPAKVAADVVATGFELAKKLRKVAVRAGVCDGFIGNRILAVYRQAADHMMEDGASPYQIDEAVREFGYPMGPFQVADLAGGDIGWATRKRRAPTRDPRARYVQIADRICERGWFGQKTGRGYYVYAKGSRSGAPDPEVLAIVDAERAARRHHAAQLQQRRDRAPLPGRDDQRRRQRRARRHRAAAARRRRDLHRRLWLSAPSRRPDEVCRHGRAAPGAGRHPRIRKARPDLLAAVAAAGRPGRARPGFRQPEPGRLKQPPTISALARSRRVAVPILQTRRFAMREAVIVSTARTPLTKAHRGEFNITPGPTLAAFAVRAAVERSGLDPALIEDAILGCGYPEGTTGRNVARQAIVRAGLPISIAGTTVNRFCASGLQAIAIAAGRIVVDGAPAMIAGGVESISQIRGRSAGDGGDITLDPWIVEHKPELYLSMIETADIVASRYGIDREAQDRFSAESQRKTEAAQDAGRYREEIVAVTTTMAVTDKETKAVTQAQRNGRCRYLQPARHHLRGAGQAGAGQWRRASSSPPAMPRSCPTARRPA